MDQWFTVASRFVLGPHFVMHILHPPPLACARERLSACMWARVRDRLSVQGACACCGPMFSDSLNMRLQTITSVLSLKVFIIMNGCAGACACVCARVRAWLCVCVLMRVNFIILAFTHHDPIQKYLINFELRASNDLTLF